MSDGFFSEDSLSGRNFLEIRLHGHPFAVPVELIREINQPTEITWVPNSAPHICGLTNLRGQVLPVIDLNVRLGQGKTVPNRETCVVVVDGLEGMVGLLVDAVSRVIHISDKELLPPPEFCHLKDRTMLTGIAKDGNRMIILLSITHCLSQPASHPPLPKEEGIPETEPPKVSEAAVKLLG